VNITYCISSTTSKLKNRITSETGSRHRSLVLLSNVITRGALQEKEKKWIIKLKVDIDTPIVVFSPEAPKIVINLGKCDGSMSR
jgi:hypothetical protein